MTMNKDGYERSWLAMGRQRGSRVKTDGDQVFITAASLNPILVKMKTMTMMMMMMIMTVMMIVMIMMIMTIMMVTKLSPLPQSLPPTLSTEIQKSLSGLFFLNARKFLYPPYNFIF